MKTGNKCKWKTYVGILTDIKPIFVVFSVHSAEYQRFTLQAVDGGALLSHIHYVHTLHIQRPCKQLPQFCPCASTDIEVHSNNVKRRDQNGNCVDIPQDKKRKWRQRCGHYTVLSVLAVMSCLEKWNNHWQWTLARPCDSFGYTSRIFPPPSGSNMHKLPIIANF